MSSIMCQGLQSCLEPRPVEPCVLRHKLAPPKSNFSQSSPWPQTLFPPQHQQENQENSHNEEENNNKDSKNKNNGDLGGWGFIQVLTNMSQSSKEVTETEKIYVHPLLKLSSSSLSKESLEMCTESLGSETGSDISESSDEFSSISLKSENSHTTQLSKSREFTKKLTCSGSFPPPLTSISGSESVRVRPHREGGRLVIEAVTVASCNTYFHAERVDGRLRLCLQKESSLNCDNGVAEGKEKEVAEGGVEEHAGEYYDEDDEDDDGEDDHDENWVEGIGGNSGKVGCEIEIGELPRPSRCKEGGRGNKGMPSWGPFWVTIS